MQERIGPFSELDPKDKKEPVDRISEELFGQDVIGVKGPMAAGVMGGG